MTQDGLGPLRAGCPCGSLSHPTSFQGLCICIAESQAGPLEPWESQNETIRRQQGDPVPAESKVNVRRSLDLCASGCGEELWALGQDRSLPFLQNPAWAPTF